MRKRTRIGAAFLSLTLVFGMGHVAYDVYAQASWTEVKLEKEYKLLSEVEIPKRQLTVEGKKAEADAVVTLPDGTVTKEDVVKLTDPGIYTVTYTAKVEGKAYLEEETFVVNNNLYTFTSDETSASYGKYEHSKETKGLMVRLAEGDTLTFNEPIDVANMSSDDWLVRAFATPDEIGHADFRKLCFKLTDAEDPSVYLYMSAKQTSESDILPYTYCVAGGDGQVAKGMEMSNGHIHEELYFGTVAFHSFGMGGELCSKYSDEQMIGFRLNQSNMEVSIKESLVCDLDSSKFFDTVWEGFPSGKAYLSVWGDLYASKTANFCLVKVGNLDLTKTVIKDTEPPVITVDNKYKEMPKAVKGGTYQYIPTATAKDITSGECKVTTKVYYNYQSPGHTVLDVTDGTFKTDKYGYYAIVYEATDQFGNLGQEILWVKAENELKQPTITLTHETPSTWIQGEKYVPGTYEFTCYSGEPILHVYATKDGETYDLDEGLRLEETGTYHVVYELKDCAGQTATAEFDMEVKTGDKPVLAEDLTFDTYMMEESEYIFPTVHFNDYRSGKKETKVATGKIVDAAGTTEVKAGDTYKFTVDKNGDQASLIFVCENASYEVKLPVIKTWGQENGRAKVLLENYFVGEGVTYSQTDQIGFAATKPNGGWAFANALLAENFSMTLKGIKGKTDYESIVVKLVDSRNPEEVLDVELPYKADEFLVETAGGKQILKKGVNIGTVGNISIEFKEGSLYVAGTKIKKAQLPEFSSDSLYLSVSFKKAGKKAAFQLLSLNNHAFGSSKMDKVAPKIVIRGDYGGSHDYQEEITLPSAVAGDVLNPNITFTMTVLRDKEVLKDVNGKELKDVDPTKEYVIKADAYGKYNVMYTAYEGYSEKDSSMSYTMHIVDDVKPEIKMAQKKMTEGKVGDTLCIPDITVTDNETKADKIVVRRYIEDPNGVVKLLPDNSNAVKATKAGTYKWIVLAVDEAGNVQNESWTITVTAK